MVSRSLVVVAALSLFTFGGGCSADIAEGDELVEGSEADLSPAGKALLGAYSGQAGSFRGLVLTDKWGENDFIAHIDPGVVCVMAPCPPAEKIQGTFTVGAKTITFRSSTASVFAQHLLGRYDYVLASGGKLTLSRANVTHSLEQEGSYCAEAYDCWSQAIAHPACIGGWTCSTEKTCDWQCAIRPPPTDCTTFDLDGCTSHNECAPIWGRGPCTPGTICTADVEFQGCADVGQ